jgi:hypothetical protein
MVTFEDVDAIASGLPGVTVGTKWRRRTWIANDKGFAWERPLTKADLKRLGDTPPPEGEILGVRVEDLDAKDALLSLALPGFFTIAHFEGYPAVLIELRNARAKDVRTAVLDAHRSVTTAPPKAKRPARSRPRRKG